jgi:hypothetical protein
MLALSFQRDTHPWRRWYSRSRMVVESHRQQRAADETTQSSEATQASAAQDRLDAQSAELGSALLELHSKQDAFERNVQEQSRTLKNLSRTEPFLPLLRRRLTEARQLTPARGGFFVELFVGEVNVRFVRKKERLAFKTDYEKLKQRLAPFFVVLCIACLLFEENRWLHMILQLALTTYYISLAIRENILRVNGSNIKSWWIIHHYLTIMQGVLLLTWPNGTSYARFRTGLHYFGLYNAVLQIFQTRYQIARLYTLRSLGLVGEMDVASSDSTQIHWSESMQLLLPLIFFGQALQLIQAVSLFRIYYSSPHELQILLLGLLFAANFIGNVTTTAVVVMEKSKSRTTRRRHAHDNVEGGPESSRRFEPPAHHEQTHPPEGDMRKKES